MVDAVDRISGPLRAQRHAAQAHPQGSPDVATDPDAPGAGALGVPEAEAAASLAAPERLGYATLRRAMKSVADTPPGGPASIDPPVRAGIAGPDA